MTLSGANTYTGATAISGGILSVSADNNLGTAPSSATADDLTLNGGTLQNTANLTLNANRGITLGASGGTLDQNSGTTLTYGGIIAGSGALTKTDSGTLVLSGTNTYTGATTISSGTLSVQNASGLGGTNNTAATTVASGAVLQLANGITTNNAGTLYLNGAGAGPGSGALQGIGSSMWNSNVQLNSNATIYSSTAGSRLDIGNASATSTLALGGNTVTVDGPGDTYFYSNAGVAGDTGGLIKNGTGTLTFFGYNTFYTGATMVNAGSLDLAVGPFTTGWYGINGPLTIGTGPANSAAAGTVKVDIWSNSYTGQISPNSAVTINSDGILNVGASTGLGSLTLNGGQVSISSGQTVTPTGDITSNANSAHETSLISGGALYLNTGNINVARDSTLASDLIISSAIGGTNLNKNGNGTLVLSGANTYTGGTAVSAGVVNISNAYALGGPSGGTTTVSSGAALQLQGGIAVGSQPLTLNGTGIANDGALRNISGNNSWSGPVTLGSATRVNSDAGTLTLSGNIGGNGQNLSVGGAGSTVISGVIGTTTGSLTKDGAGTVVLAGSNTYTGGTNINAGTLKLGASERIADSSAVTISSGATFNLNGYTETIGALSGAGTLQLASGTLIVGSGNASSTFSGSIATSDTGTLEKTGSGTLTLGAGMNFASGNLILNGGTLGLGGFTSTFSSLTVTADSTLDFGGTSILNLSSMAVNSGVTLTVTNWADAVDFFYSVSNPGSANLGRIVFSGYTGPYTRWQSWDTQVTPVPEPSVSGAVLMGLGLLVAAWRGLRGRRRRG